MGCPEEASQAVLNAWWPHSVKAMREEVIGDARLFCGDCRDLLPGLTGVDVCITDPPYSAKTHQGARRGDASNGWKTASARPLIDFESMNEVSFVALCAQLIDVTARWVVMTCDWRHAAYAEKTELPFIRAGVWIKQDSAPQFTGDRPATGWEAVAMFHRHGRKRWNGGGGKAVWSTPCARGNHPSEKPVELVVEWARLFSDEGETVLDPFMGSGTTGVACARLGRRFIGCEIEPKYFDIAFRRIEQAYRQRDLFVAPPKAAPAVTGSLFE